MYGFISIENTVIVFGAGGGLGMLCHICHKSFSVCRTRLQQLFTALTSPRWLQNKGQILLPFFSVLGTMSLPLPPGRRLLAYWATGVGHRSGLPCIFPLPWSISSPLPVLNVVSPLAVYSESLLVEVECVGEAWLHLWYLVTDDLHQHVRELHLQGLGLTKGVETEVQ